MQALSVVGTRPNFMKLAPVSRALAQRAGVKHVVVHTGQHYDDGMSEQFFRDLALPPPDHHLAVGPGSHAAQTAAVLERLAPLLEVRRPDVVLVYGDVNSTLAAALAAAKLNLRVAHVEAGLRSGDRTMPEEINRIVTDHVADLLFVPSRDAVQTLRHEGIRPERIHFVGNVMIDTLVRELPRARALGAPQRHGLSPAGYAVVTLHRPSNVDDPGRLRELLGALAALGRRLPVVFPVHPRTRRRIEADGTVGADGAALQLLEPVGYTEMLGLVDGARLVITDSGGLQEETTFLGIPCLTVRPNTERPVTCLLGTNRLVAPQRDALLSAAAAALADGDRARPSIELWDGHAAERIAALLCGEAGARVSAPAPSALAGAVG